ncbi:hypothetical protein SAMN05444277_11665 [Parafilimonas terrae]|uniref:Uncharacterized protein n=1 Tax=Parafilimonas terrae TaxID=1465490 RepID=A0A1I5Z495_9BACT|nr:hypothetical protein SAMN05444277_11665 [Parafilimonas terrae]
MDVQAAEIKVCITAKPEKFKKEPFAEKEVKGYKINFA